MQCQGAAEVRPTRRSEHCQRRATTQCARYGQQKYQLITARVLTACLQLHFRFKFSTNIKRRVNSAFGAEPCAIIDKGFLRGNFPVWSVLTAGRAHRNVFDRAR
jgi:hypothetical protein